MWNSSVDDKYNVSLQKHKNKKIKYTGIVLCMGYVFKNSFSLTKVREGDFHFM